MLDSTGKLPQVCLVVNGFHSPFTTRYLQSTADTSAGLPAAWSLWWDGMTQVSTVSANGAQGQCLLSSHFSATKMLPLSPPPAGDGAVPPIFCPPQEVQNPFLPASSGLQARGLCHHLTWWKAVQFLESFLSKQAPKKKLTNNPRNEDTKVNCGHYHDQESHSGQGWVLCLSPLEEARKTFIMVENLGTD